MGKGQFYGMDGGWYDTYGEKQAADTAWRQREEQNKLLREQNKLLKESNKPTETSNGSYKQWLEKKIDDLKKKCEERENNNRKLFSEACEWLMNHEDDKDSLSAKLYLKIMSEIADDKDDYLNQLKRDIEFYENELDKEWNKQFNEKYQNNNSNNGIKSNFLKNLFVISIVLVLFILLIIMAFC